MLISIWNDMYDMFRIDADGLNYNLQLSYSKNCCFDVYLLYVPMYHIKEVYSASTFCYSLKTGAETYLK